MRLIDLDQTIFVPIVDETRGGVEYEMEMTMGFIAEENIAKLRKRYPHGFAAERSINRVE